jgi:ABC-type glycerol-3-phosphate transport system substrate-binding protein
MPVVIFAVFILLCCLSVQAERTKLHVAMWINSGEDYNAMVEIIEAYEQMNPDIEIELTYQAWAGYHDKMITMVASGLAPDVMVLSRTYLPQFVNSGAIQPMDTYFARETRFNYKTDITELVSGTYKSRIYGIPIWGGPAIMVYNTDLFNLAGLTTPDKLSQTDAWTWDTYVELGKKLTVDTNGDGVIDRFMAAEMTEWDPVWQARILQSGGRIISDDGTKAVIDQPPAIRALEYWLGLAYEHHIAPQAGEAAKAFEVQGMAMAHSWSTTAPSVYGKFKGEFEMGLTVLPAGPEGYFHIAGGCPITISSTTKYPQEAYEFAIWFALFSDQWKVVGLPASMRILSRDYMGYLGQYFANPQAIIQAYEHRTRPEAGIGPAFTALSQARSPILQDAIAGRISASEAAVRMAAAMNAVLAGMQ